MYLHICKWQKLKCGWQIHLQWVIYLPSNFCSTFSTLFSENRSVLRMRRKWKLSLYGPFKELFHLLPEILFLLNYYIVVSKWCLPQIYHLCDFIFKNASWILLIILGTIIWSLYGINKVLFKCSYCYSSRDVSCCFGGRGFNQWARACQRNRIVKGTRSVQVHFFYPFWSPYKRKNAKSALEGWALNLEKEQL